MIVWYWKTIWGKTEVFGIAERLYSRRHMEINKRKFYRRKLPERYKEVRKGGIYSRLCILFRFINISFS